MGTLTLTIPPEVLPLLTDVLVTWVSAGVVEPPVGQIAVPAADLSAGGWTTQAGASTGLYATVDESPADDADWAQSPPGPVGATWVFRLAPLVPPNTRDDHVLTLRVAHAPNTSGALLLTASLYAADGVTLIKAWDPITPGVLGDVALTLTPEEAALIPAEDYATGLVVALEANTA